MQLHTGLVIMIVMIDSYDDGDVQAAAPAAGGGDQVRGQGPAAGRGSCQRQNCRGQCWYPCGVGHLQSWK